MCGIFSCNPCMRIVDLHDKVYGDSNLVLLTGSCHKYYNKIASTETSWLKKCSPDIKEHQTCIIPYRFKILL